MALKTVLFFVILVHALAVFGARRNHAVPSIIAPPHDQYLRIPVPHGKIDPLGESLPGYLEGLKF